MKNEKQLNETDGKPYIVKGNGKHTIVFVHYFGGDAGSWQWLVKRLPKKFTAVLLNLPGFGGTEGFKEPSIYDFALYINRIIKELDLKEYTLCGHSMGAKLILYAAQLTTGPKPKRLILIAPSPPTVEAMSKEEKVRMLNHPNENEAIHTVEGATRKKLRKKKFKYAVESQLRIDSKVWQWWLNKGMNNNIASRITGIEIPTFIICSKNDPVISIDAVYTDTMPNVYKPKLIQLSKSGHLIPMEVPRKLARILKRI